MDEELFIQIKEYIKNNLSVNIKEISRGEYKIEILLEEEVISYSYT